MCIVGLDHVNLRTTQLATMAEWYERVIGLVPGPRPNFPFPGAWLYASDTAIVHLIGVDDEGAAGSERPLKLEHFAMRAEGLDAFLAVLDASGTDYRRAELDDFGIVQINVLDPDGNHIHVDFATDRTAS